MARKLQNPLRAHANGKNFPLWLLAGLLTFFDFHAGATVNELN